MSPSFSINSRLLGNLGVTYLVFLSFCVLTVDFKGFCLFDYHDYSYHHQIPSDQGQMLQT